MPKTRDKGHVIRNRPVRLEERGQARACMASSTDKAHKLQHVGRHFVKLAPRNERVEHLTARLAALAEETWILGGVKLGMILLVRLQLPVVFDGGPQRALIENTAHPIMKNGSDHAALMAGAFLPRRPRRTMRRKPASCCAPQEPLTKARSAPASPVSMVLSRNLAVPKEMSHTDKVVP